MNPDNKNTNPFDVLSGLKFSDSDYDFEEEVVEESEEMIDKSYRKSQKIRVWLEKKKRNGKPVSIITGLDEPEDELKYLAKLLKKKLGVGGSFSSDEIIIQGQNRDKIIDLLKEEGFRDVKKAGG